MYGAAKDTPAASSPVPVGGKTGEKKPRKAPYTNEIATLPLGEDAPSQNVRVVKEIVVDDEDDDEEDQAPTTLDYQNMV